MSSDDRADEVYSRLLELAEEDPVRAIDEWISEFSSDLGHGPGEFLLHQRGLERLLRAAARGTASAELIAEARSRAEEVLGTARRSVVVLDGGQTAAVGEATITERSEPREPLAGQLVEAVELNRQAARWARNAGLRWVGGALMALKDDRRPAHLAFLPLRLYPGGRFVEQAAAALREAEDAGLRVTATLRELIDEDLAQDGEISFLDLRIGMDLWKLFSLIRPGAHTDNTATRYLQRLRFLASKNPSFLTEVGGPIGEAVANSSLTTLTKAAFFRRWREDGTAWSADPARHWLRWQLEEISEFRLNEGFGDGKFREVWSAWLSDPWTSADAVFQEQTWGTVIRDSVLRALGRSTDVAELKNVGAYDEQEPGSIIQSETAYRYEDADIFEGV